MPMTRRTIVGSALIGVLVGTIGMVSGLNATARRHTQDVPRSSAPFASIDEKAKAAADGSPAAVRAFTDQIFESSLLSGAAASLKDRVFRNETAFRRGEQPGIREEDLVKLANDQIRQLNGADFMYVSVGQLHMSREYMRLQVHQLADPVSQGDSTRKPGYLASEMSPAEVVLMTTHLALQKLANPEYQIPPQQWEQQMRERRLWARDHPWGQAKVPPPRVSFGPSPLSTEPVMAVQQALADESSTATITAHKLLDALGVQR